MADDSSEIGDLINEYGIGVVLTGFAALVTTVAVRWRKPGPGGAERPRNVEVAERT